MPFIEEVIQPPVIWGEYLPGHRLKGRNSCVKVKDVGCVFIGTVQECQEYIRDNAEKYEKKNSRRLLTK